jgi:hypothetical protein
MELALFRPLHARMKFTYTVTVVDLMQFGEHVYRNSPTVRRTKLLWCVFGPALFALWALHYYWESRRFDWIFVFLAAQAVVGAITLPRFFDRLSLKAIYSRYVMQPDRDDSGDFQLLVSDDAVTEIAATRETKIKWAQLHKVEAHDDRIYVFIDPRSAIIIPPHTFAGDGDYDCLRVQILKHVQKAHA